MVTDRDRDGNMTFRGELTDQPECNCNFPCGVTSDLRFQYRMAFPQERLTMVFISENEFDQRYIMDIGKYHRGNILK